MKYRLGATTSIAVLIVTTALSGPARADGYDPAVLCGSASADVAASLATVRANTVAEITAAGGLAVRQESTAASISHGLDSAQRLSRHDVAQRGAKPRATHRMVDGVAGVTYTGHVLGDAGDQPGQLALKALGASESWIAAAASDAALRTADAMIDEALDASDLPELQTSAGSHAITCTVTAPVDETAARLQLSDSFGSTTVTSTLEFTPTGALATLRTVTKVGAGKATVRTGTFAYPGQTVNLPFAMSSAEWNAVAVRASFAALKTHTLAAARAKVKKVSGHAARVAAVRKIGKSEAAGFFRTATSSSVRDGVAVTTAKASGSKGSWSFALTVTGAKVKLTTNLP